MLAIVLKRKDWREFDELVSFYSQDYGRLDLISRGSKKITSKNSSYLAPGLAVEIEVVKGKEIDYLIKVQPTSLFVRTQNDLDNNLLLGYILNFCLKILKIGHRDETVFALLLSFLKHISQPTLACPNLAYGFILKMLTSLGYGAQMKNCSICGQNQGLFGLAIEKGGIICHNCYAKEDPKIKVEPMRLEDQKNLLAMQTASWTQICQMPYSVKLFSNIIHLAQYHFEIKINRFSL
ncbi:MAG: DNA repair protein RecO [Candidatus Magasanikbacteria bacterium CG10_big_fil_rev_8_21_14_0_10_40_10]|uniref:DNA repair protein RecO n=1 Tax=Candidatus Magasanikbacteria bacterium CG10_big_fil_rev_8_21_14_0_10_40_10 TaxID=1974648 RepID=A0A2M6W497_9BACT|nr:MAG: DNA repair protein RecO [Candidatus Magasanikbacteria bacterium CG10_big_fil_rev_8_21_14_0_10_40_10]